MLIIMSADSILKAMTTGVMQQQASALTAAQKKAIAEHLAGAPVLGAGHRAAVADVRARTRHRRSTSRNRRSPPAGESSPATSAS